MTKPLYLLLAVCLFTACRKEQPIRFPLPPDGHPQMVYKDLENAVVAYGRSKRIDIDNDGTTDFVFGLQLVGDPILQRDRRQYIVHSGINRNLLNDAADQTPVLQKRDTVGLHMPGYTWYEISSIVLAEKLVYESGSIWDGRWKSARFNYLPVQVKRQGQRYHGWIELSFDTTGEKLVLHRSAISTAPGKTVKAGF